MTNKTYEYFVKDLVYLLINEIETSFSERENCTSEEDKEFIKGRIFSLYQVLNLIKSQAIAFNIELDDLGLEKLNLEKFLMDKTEK